MRQRVYPWVIVRHTMAGVKYWSDSGWVKGKDAAIRYRTRWLARERISTMSDERISTMSDGRATRFTPQVRRFDP